LEAEFNAPTVQASASDGWEDGICISRDGLHLFAIYIPADMLSFVLAGADQTKAANYLRGPTLGMDLTSTPVPGISPWIHSNIVVASRASLTQPFGPWALTGMARPIWSEGAPQPMGTGTSWDVFAYTSNEHAPDYHAHICMARGAATNPAVLGSMLPAPVTTGGTEDNPHVERLSASDLVLFFDSDDRPGASGAHDLWFTTSSDDGATWATPAPVSTVNTTAEEEQPHLYRDGDGHWWLYFTATNPADGKLAIYRSSQTVDGDWGAWSTRTLVIGAGNTAGVGEPTLTAAGDLSFVVIYSDDVHGSATNRFDADPWIAPRRNGAIVHRGHPALPTAAQARLIAPKP
jgi:hypothetical protein